MENNQPQTKELTEFAGVIDPMSWQADTAHCVLTKSTMTEPVGIPAEAVPPPPVEYLKEPLPDLASWTRYFTTVEIPIMAETAHALEALREREEEVNAGMLAELVESDPFFTMKVLAYVAQKRRNLDATATETVISSLVMMGVAPFFRFFGPQPTVEDRLHAVPQALEGLRALIKRAHRAAHFATGFAVHREDTDVVVIRMAAFLNDFPEMLMWCLAPTMELEIRAMQKSNPTLRTAALQRFVFNIDLNDLRVELMKAWRFPELLMRISDGKHMDHPMVRNVMLASRLARHTENGWDNPALPDDFEDIAKLLNAAPLAVRGFVYKIDQTG